MTAAGNLVVTTGHKMKAAHVALAREIAQELGAPCAARKTASLDALRAAYGVPFVLVVRERLTLETGDGALVFHPGMAHLRIKSLRHGGEDHLVRALDLCAGMRVLDCTLGMGADAIVESFAAGETGEVVALEKSPAVAALIGRGLRDAAGYGAHVEAAMRRVRVVCADYLDYLARQPDDSFDAVYFDPMFRHPFTASAGIHPLRLLAESAPVSREAVREACRVARRRVVLKESSRSLEFERLGFSESAGGRYSRVRYGVIRL